jgi:hypothetical protein
MILKQDFGEKISNLQTWLILLSWTIILTLCENFSNIPLLFSKIWDPEKPWPKGYKRPERYETPGLDLPEIRAESNKIEAQKAYDTLIQMSERAIRPIRCNPRWKIVLWGGDLLYEDAEKIEMLFYEGSDFRDSDSGRHWTKTDFIAAHWGAECRQFQEELRRWQNFRDVQQWIREHRLNKAREKNMKRQRYSQDSHLKASLKKLKNWKKYQVYFQREIDKCKKRIEEIRLAMKTIERKNSKVIMNKKKVRE